MARSEKKTEASERQSNVFADLRKHNEQAARVARLLQARRNRHIEQVLQFQRKHQAR